jgi:5-methylcytosine-specific restriction endonuclease McrA
VSSKVIRLKGKALEALRLDCFRLDRWFCRECGRRVFSISYELPSSAHMAHIRNKRMWGDTLENVRTLCGDCHRKEHAYGKDLVKPVQVTKKEARGE